MLSDSHGLFALQQPCPRCRGNGTIVEKPCKTCRGTGRERATKRYTVKIPAGAKDGTRIRLKGRGEAGRNGGPAGDLWVVTHVTPSPLYERRGSDLLIDVPITYPEAALGATVEVPTPDGKISLKVPAGSQDGKLLKVKGRGAPKLKGSGRGDLLARLKVTVPKKLTKAEKDALEALQKVVPRGSARGGVHPLMDRPRYTISVAAELVGMHQQTLRMYEAKGLVRPQRTPGNTRRYSEADLERLRLIQRLTTELGLNLAGVEHVIRLQDELAKARARAERLERQLRAEIQEVHRSYKRELVLYRPGRHPATREGH